MIRAQIEASTLEEYYTKLRAAQEKAHGAGYTAYHDCIREHCGIAAHYLEIGVNQGASLAAAMLGGFVVVEGMDINLSNIAPHRHLFGDYCQRARIVMDLWECDSLAFEPKDVDFLFIDGNHQTAHVAAELNRHGPHVTRFILLHDTAKYRELHPLAERWAGANGWTVQERNTSGAGHTLLERQAC